MDLAAGTVLRMSWGFDRVVTQDAPNLSAPPKPGLASSQKGVAGQGGMRVGVYCKEEAKSISQSHVGSRKKEELRKKSLISSPWLVFQWMLVILF